MKGGNNPIFCSRQAQRRCSGDSTVVLRSVGHNSPALGGVLGAVISTIRFSRRVPLRPISSTWGPFPFHSSRRSCSKAKFGIGGHACPATALPSSPVPSGDTVTPGHSTQGTGSWLHGGEVGVTHLFLPEGNQTAKSSSQLMGLLKETFSLPPFRGHPSSPSLPAEPILDEPNPSVRAGGDSAELLCL